MTKIGCVHRVPLFNNLACDEQSKVQELLYHKTFKKGEIFFLPMIQSSYRLFQLVL